MTQETVEKPAEKSMAKLAEILRERGVHVVQVIDGHLEDDGFRTALPSISFEAANEQNAVNIADYVAEIGYPVEFLKRVWRYSGIHRSRQPNAVIVLSTTMREDD